MCNPTTATHAITLMRSILQSRLSVCLSVCLSKLSHSYSAISIPTRHFSPLFYKNSFSHLSSTVRTLKPTTYKSTNRDVSNAKSLWPITTKTVNTILKMSRSYRRLSIYHNCPFLTVCCQMLLIFL